MTDLSNRLPQPANRTDPLIVFGLCLVGAVLSFYGLASHSLGGDEGFSFRLANSTFERLFALIYRDVHPPLYFLLLKGWMEVLGDSVFSMRSLSAVFAIATVGVTYLLGARLHSRFVGVMAATLLLTSAFHLTYAQELRMYSMLSFFVSLTFLFLFRLEARPTWGRAAWYAAALACALYTHYYAIFPVFAQGCYVAVRSRKELYPFGARALAGLFAGALLFAPWIPTLYSQTVRVHERFWIKSKGLDVLYSGARAYGGPDYYWVFLAAAVFAFFAYRSRSVNGARLWLLLGWASLPIVIPFLLSYERPIFTMRYAQAGIVGFLLLVSMGVSFLSAYRAWIPAALLLLALSVPELGDYYEQTDKQQWHVLTRDLAERTDGDDLVIYHPSYMGLNLLYYLRDSSAEVSKFPIKGSVNFTADELIELQNRVSEVERIHLILVPLHDREGRILAAVSETHDLTKENDYGITALYSFLRKKEGKPAMVSDD